MLGEQGYAVARRYLLRQKFTESGFNIPTYWDIETSRYLSRILVNLVLTFFHPRPQFSRFKARTRLHSFELKRLEKKINTLNNQTNSFEDQKKFANAFTIPRSMSVVVPPNCSKQMPQRRKGVGLLYLWQRFWSHLQFIGRSSSVGQLKERHSEEVLKFSWGDIRGGPIKV